MFEIIPNWHQILVHFTVALLFFSSLLFFIASILPKAIELKKECLMVAQWNLWLGTFITLGTVLAGWQAYNTVIHDTPSYLAMTEHRNQALITISIFIMLSLWKFICRHMQKLSFAFIFLTMIGAILLFITLYKGNELVYRYGIGVISLPNLGSEHKNKTKNINIDTKFFNY